MPLDSFFEQMTPQSELKIDLVTKYFDAWSKIMMKRSQMKALGYVDLFSGPGRYKNGEPSTPIRILSKAVLDDRLRTCLRTFFNDSKAEHIISLRHQVSQIPNIETLDYTPQIMNEVVNNELINDIKFFSEIPTLYFIDPWGYKGVTSSLLRRTVSGYGSECILFFNFNRVNSAISNPIVETHMRAMFGEDVAHDLISQLIEIDNSLERETLIVSTLADVLNQAGATHQIKFRFEQTKSERTSHYIVFASKHFVGFKIMRDIMARASIGLDGVPVYEWKPQRSPQLQMDLGLNRSQVDDQIRELLIRNYSGQEAQLGELFVALSAGTTFTLPDFQRVITAMENNGSAIVDKPLDHRPLFQGKATLGEKRRIRILG